MLNYLKMLYRSVTIGAYYDHLAKTTSRERLRDKINMLMAIKA